jgi:hypothetical protein
MLLAHFVRDARSRQSHELGERRTTENALSRLTGVPRIEAIFRAHLGDERKILAASDQTDDG